jgi:hypothetical protein
MSPFFSYHTVDRLLSNSLVKASTSNQKSYSSLASIQASAAPSQLIDILLTNLWPISITQFSSAPLPDPQLSSIGAPPLSDVIRKTKPRYHFAAGGGHPPAFWEREPFVWDDEQGRVSRFVSLGAFGGEPTSRKKQRVCSIFMHFSSRSYILDTVVLRFYYRAKFCYDRTSCSTAECNEESIP